MILKNSPPPSYSAPPSPPYPYNYGSGYQNIRLSHNTNSLKTNFPSGNLFAIFSVQEWGNTTSRMNRPVTKRQSKYVKPPVTEIKKKNDWQGQ